MKNFQELSIETHWSPSTIMKKLELTTSFSKINNSNFSEICQMLMSNESAVKEVLLKFQSNLNAKEFPSCKFGYLCRDNMVQKYL